MSDNNSNVAVWALLISFSSAAFTFFTYWDQTAERIDIEVKPSAYDYVHAYTLRKDKKYDSYVRLVGRWYEIQLSNNSRKTLSLTSLAFGEKHQRLSTINHPLFKKLNINENEVRIGQPVNFPVKLESGEVIKASILLPISIYPEYGKILVNELRKLGNPIDTSIERIIYDPGFIKKYESDFISGMNDSAIARSGITIEAEIQGLDMERRLFSEYTDGIYKFSDNTEEYDFGFIHKHDSHVMSNAIENILEDPNLNIDIVSPLYSDYKLLVTTGSGTEFSIILHSGVNALDPLEQSK